MIFTPLKFFVHAFLAVSFLVLGFYADFAGAQDAAADTVETQHSADPLLSRYL